VVEEVVVDQAEAVDVDLVIVLLEEVDGRHVVLDPVDLQDDSAAAAAASMIVPMIALRMRIGLLD
jgi:hypothetical protein